MANVLMEETLLLQIERVRVELRERVARAHQVLQERETALLSELQLLEGTYRGEGVAGQILELSRLKEDAIATLQKAENQEFLQHIIAQLDARMRELEASLERAGDRMKQVELEWDINLEGILSRTGSIRVRGVADYKEKGNPIKVAGKQQDTIYLTEGEPTRGLRNIGNTCFMNSILHCLSHTLPIRRLYVSDEYKQQLNYNRGDLSYAFTHVIEELWNTATVLPVDPYDLKKQVESMTSTFPGYNQHDAHEFMRFLLNELHEEINRASEEGRKSPADNETLEEACARYLTWEDSRISQLFSGMLRSDVCCSVCSNQSTVYIPFMDLSLPILNINTQPYYLYSSSSDPTVQLDTCLSIFTTEETLDGDERPYCNKCVELTTATKHLTIDKLPRFLVIQLRRFSGKELRTKLSTPVQFYDSWILTDVYNNTHTYSLYGIVSHSGSIYGGHYIAFCKYNGIWRCFNDSTTSIVSWEYVKYQEAYILLYTEDIL